MPPMYHKFVSPNPIGLSLTNCLLMTDYNGLQHPNAPFILISFEQETLITQELTKEHNISFYSVDTKA